MSGLPVIDEDGEVGDLSLVAPGTFRPAKEVLPPDLYAGLLALKNRGEHPKSAAPKIQTAIRFDPDVLEGLRALGKGCVLLKRQDQTAKPPEGAAASSLASASTWMIAAARVAWTSEAQSRNSTFPALRAAKCTTVEKKHETLKQLKHFSQEERLVIVTTGKDVGEGFDEPRLDTLFLAAPISWRGTLQQYAERRQSARQAGEGKAGACAGGKPCLFDFTGRKDVGKAQNSGAGRFSCTPSQAPARVSNPWGRRPLRLLRQGNASPAPRNPKSRRNIIGPA
jgi:hypothetical protein